MINSYQARQIADAWLNSSKLQITQVQTLPFGWVFFYQSKAYLAGDDSAALAGNAPIIVARDTGQVTVTGTAQPIEAYLAAYQAAEQRSQALLDQLGGLQAQTSLVDGVIAHIKKRLGGPLLKLALKKRQGLSDDDADWVIEQVRSGLQRHRSDSASCIERQPLFALSRERAALDADWPSWVQEAEKNGWF